MSGWIKLHRDIRKNWIWQKADYVRSFIDLLMTANHEKKTRLYSDSLVVIERGEVVSSLASLSKRWKMTVHKTRHFLDLLEKDSIITRKTSQGFTHLSICKYDTYQNVPQTKRKSTANPPQIHRKSTATPKELKELKKEKEVSVSRSKNIYDSLYKRFGLVEDHYSFYRPYIDLMINKWGDKTGRLVAKFLMDRKSNVRDLRYLCEQGIDKYATPKRNVKFKKTKLGDYLAYCQKCQRQLFIKNEKQLYGSSECHGVDLIPERTSADA